MESSHEAAALALADRWWFVEIIVGILVLIGVNFLFKRIVRQLRLRFSAQASNWQEKMDYILYVPFQILMWILGITLVMEILAHRFDFSFFGHYIHALRSTGFVVCVVWVVLRGKNVMQREFIDKNARIKQMDLDFIQVMGKILSVVAVILSLMVILQVWGLDVGPLIAFGGIGAAAIGFSAKDVLANLFGGVMLHVNRPFMIGDFINLPNQEVEGLVEEIGWNLTTMRDKEKRPVYLPNSLFSNALVINVTRMTHRRFFEKVGLRHKDFDKVPTLVENMKAVFATHPDVDVQLPVLVVLNELGANAIEILIDFYVLKTSYEQFYVLKQQLLNLVYQEIRRVGAEIPSPTMEISGKITTVP